MLFNGKGYLLYYDVAVYILAQSKEEYSLIWKAKLLTIQTDKDKWLKKVINDKTIDFCDLIIH